MQALDILHGSAALLLVIASGASVFLTMIQLPGNWIMVVLTAIVAWLLPEDSRFDIRWAVVGIILGLAVFAELLELLTGTIAAKRQGASRRAAGLAFLGGILGAIVGAGGGSLIPVLGTLIGILVGGGLGAFLGGYIGETWKGRSESQALAVARSVAIARTFGTLAKLAVGVVMFVITAWDAAF